MNARHWRFFFRRIFDYVPFNVVVKGINDELHIRLFHSSPNVTLVRLKSIKWFKVFIPWKNGLPVSIIKPFFQFFVVVWRVNQGNRFRHLFMRHILFRYLVVKEHERASLIRQARDEGTFIRFIFQNFDAHERPFIANFRGRIAFVVGACRPEAVLGNRCSDVLMFQLNHTFPRCFGRRLCAQLNDDARECQLSLFTARLQGPKAR
jgi:hypothetical protein